MAKLKESIATLNKSVEKPEQRVAFGDCETHVGLVLDSSGSMHDVKAEAIRGFNKQLDVIRKKAKHQVRTHLTLFGTPGDIEYRLENAEVGELVDLHQGNYMPYGSTPLLDAIGHTTKQMERYDKGGEKQAFLVIAISDGQENTSGDFDWESMEELIKRLNGTGRWTFVFIGPEEQHQQFEWAGVSPDNMLGFDGSVDEITGKLGTGASSLDKFLEARNKGNLLPAFFGKEQK